MALESATYINSLVNTNPSGSDSISQGDDHIRLIKSVLKNSFPNVASATTPIVAVTHNLPAASSYMRNETYATTAQTITHTKVSSTSTLYITYNGNLNFAFNFENESAIQAWVRLSNSSGTLIGGTTDDILWAFTDDVGEGTGVSWDMKFGVSSTWKVTSANCPDGTTGANTFTIYGKMNEGDDGGVTYNYGTMICLEVEQ